MKFLLLILILPTIFAHQNCCNHTERKWHGNISLSATNTSNSYTPTNHHQGLGLDHSHISAAGPVGNYFDASTSLAFNTSKKNISRKVLFKKNIEELALSTTDQISSNFRAKVGKFASYISPNNQKNCCGYAFIKRPILYRSFLGGHLVENGAHFDCKIDVSEKHETALGFEALQGKGLMSQSNKVGLLSLIAQHKNKLHENHFLNLSLAYVLNRLYNQTITKTKGHIGCCQASAYTGKNMAMANTELLSKISKNTEHSFSFEYARVSKLARKFEKHKYHSAYNFASVTSFKNLSIGTIQTGLRFDRLRGMQFCHHGGGAYFTKILEKTAMLGWQPHQNHNLKFEYTNQNLKNQKNNNITQLKYNFSFDTF